MYAAPAAQGVIAICSSALYAAVAEAWLLCIAVGVLAVAVVKTMVSLIRLLESYWWHNGARPFSQGSKPDCKTFSGGSFKGSLFRSINIQRVWCEEALEEQTGDSHRTNTAENRLLV